MLAFSQIKLSGATSDRKAVVLWSELSAKKN